jgi:hypothetical protein
MGMIAPVAVFEMEGSSYLIATPHFLVLRKTVKRSIERLGGGSSHGPIGVRARAGRQGGKGREAKTKEEAISGRVPCVVI